MKKLIVTFFIGLGIQLPAQDLFMRAVTEVKGMGALGKSTVLSYSRKGQSKVESTMMGITQTVLTDENKVMVVNPDLCGVFTKGELINDGLDDQAEYKDVVVSLEDETMTLLGFTCKKAVIKYKITGLADYRYESVYWYTDEIKSPDNSDLPSMNRTNSLFEAINKLGGVVLYTESVMKVNGLKTIMKVTEVSTDKIRDEVFVIKTKDCEKPKNLEEYKKEIRKRNVRTTHMGY